MAERVGYLVVSILAQPEGRALHQQGRAAVCRENVSILAQPEGRALHLIYEVDDGYIEGVSILAQPEGRALLSGPGNFITLDQVSILAQPEGRALRRAGADRHRVALFQSSPNPKVGRYSPSVLSIT